MQFISIISLLFLFNSCTHLISVRTDYLPNDRLASFYVGTPDPQLTCPSSRQRLIVSWCFSKHTFKKYQNLSVSLSIRLRNRKEIVKTHTIQHLNGYYIYPLSDCLFRETGGILTYQVHLIGDGSILETWSHPLWSELISF